MPVRVRSAALMSGLAVAATGAVVTSGVLSSVPAVTAATSAISATPSIAALTNTELNQRQAAVSRDNERAESVVPAVKTAARALPVPTSMPRTCPAV